MGHFLADFSLSLDEEQGLILEQPNMETFTVREEDAENE